MAEYTELIKALRCCAENFGCPIECPRYSPADEGVRACVSRLEKDAAAAIEALQTQLPKRGKWVETEEQEWGIYPFKKQTCSVCDCKIDHTFMLACMDYFDDRDTVFHYCPNCGAKMEEDQE